jgi:hypothetical protein
VTIPGAGQLTIKLHTQPGGEVVATVSFDDRTLRVCGVVTRDRGVVVYSRKWKENRSDVIHCMQNWITLERRFGR